MTLPQTNSKFTPETSWLADKPFFGGIRPIFRGESLVLGRVRCSSYWSLVISLVFLLNRKLLGAQNQSSNASLGGIADGEHTNNFYSLWFLLLPRSPELQLETAQQKLQIPQFLGS